jgi:hypothetical protein
MTFAVRVFDPSLRATCEGIAAMELELDPPVEERDIPPLPRVRQRRRPRRPVHQQILIRRLIAVGAGLLLLLVFGLGLKACFDARGRAAMKDYVSRDVASLLSDSQQTSQQFFKTLDDPKSLTPLDYENEIKSDRGAADALVTRAGHIDTPGDMKRAQRALELTLELRRDALQTISDNVSTALAREGRAKAISAIAGAMRSFLASDVVYARIARPAMGAALAKHGIDDVRVPESAFLPASPNWLDTATISVALSKVSGSTATAAPGTHGLGLLSATLAGTPLTAGVGGQPGATTQIGSTGTPELDVEVQNQGSVEETDVQVTVSISGGAAGTSLESKIARIGPSETQTVKIPITPRPPRGARVTLEVEVQPVAGEQVQDNNRASYSVIFS